MRPCVENCQYIIGWFENGEKKLQNPHQKYLPHTHTQPPQKKKTKPKRNKKKSMTKRCVCVFNIANIRLAGLEPRRKTKQQLKQTNTPPKKGKSKTKKTNKKKTKQKKFYDNELCLYVEYCQYMMGGFGTAPHPRKKKQANKRKKKKNL